MLSESERDYGGREKKKERKKSGGQQQKAVTPIKRNLER